MVKSPKNNNGKGRNGNGRKNLGEDPLSKYKRLASLGKVSVKVINELYKPADAINRFINLTLQHTEEDSQGRQFLLESKTGIRKMSVLLNKLNLYATKMEKEIRKILLTNG